MRSSASWAVFDEVPVANSPRTKKADNANLGLATAAHVEILATVGGRRVNDNATQVEVRPAFVPSRAWMWATSSTLLKPAKVVCGNAVAEAR